MSQLGADHSVTVLLDSFQNAPADQLEPAFQALVGALWRDGAATELAPAAVPDLIERLDTADDKRKAHLVILLGLLAETELTSAVGAGLDRYLDLWRTAEGGHALSLALQYLLGHFPGDRDRILAVASELRLEADDQARVERALTPFDPADREPDIGRVFPYPKAWEMDESEQEFDKSWVRSLSAEEIEKQWHADTQTVRGNTGARAYWAVRNWAPPTPVVPDSLAPRRPNPQDADVELFRRHQAAFRCPNCGGGLAFEPTVARCDGCAAAYPIALGMLDLTVTTGGAEERGEDFLLQLSGISSMAHFYEASARPNFRRLCGFTWDGPVTLSVEEEYIANLVRAADGPVLDIAAGAGEYTQALAKAVGHDRVIALDLMPVMLASLRDRLPEVPAVIQSAAALPFGDATLGAALCWNGPQAFIDDSPKAIAEIGRCLRPGGTFATYTFRNSDDPIYRHFMSSHHFPQHSGGLRMYDLDEFKGMLEQAGLTVREEFHVGLAMFIAAEKTA